MLLYNIQCKLFHAVEISRNRQREGVFASGWPMEYDEQGRVSLFTRPACTPETIESSLVLL